MLTETHHQLVRYGIKGAVATGANVGLMALLVEFGGLRPGVAAVISTCSLLILGYVVMNRFVFAKQDGPSGVRGHLRRGAAYYAVILSGKGANYVLFLALLHVGVWYPLAWVVGSGTVFLGTFSANRWLWHGGASA